MSFDRFNLRASSREALRALDIDTPTPIQDEAMPALLEGRDVIGQAHTGSGKTLAFGLPLVERCDASSNETQALVLTPTRELAQQVATVLSDIGGRAGLRTAVIYGGVGYDAQMQALTRGAQIVVGTPGRVLDHLSRGTLRTNAVRFLVLDEADEMLDRGFARDVERILGTTPKSRQTSLFSATTPDWVHTMAKRFLNEPVFVKVGDDEAAPPDIEHSVIEVWSGDKFPILIALLAEPTEGATLVFGRTKHGVENLARRLGRLGLPVAALQGNLGQNARDRIVARFRAGHVPILLATNVAARGLDMLNIDRVINYDLPDTPELFTHRVGRTGRIGQSGEAITLITATDLQKMQEIERALGKRLPRVKAPAPMHSIPADVIERHPIEPLMIEDDAPAPVMVAQAAPGASAGRRRRRGGRGRSGGGAQTAAATA